MDVRMGRNKTREDVCMRIYVYVCECLRVSAHCVRPDHVLVRTYGHSRSRHQWLESEISFRVIP